VNGFMVKNSTSSYFSEFRISEIRRNSHGKEVR